MKNLYQERSRGMSMKKIIFSYYEMFWQKIMTDQAYSMYLPYLKLQTVIILSDVTTASQVHEFIFFGIFTTSQVYILTEIRHLKIA